MSTSLYPTVFKRNLQLMKHLWYTVPLLIMLFPLMSQSVVINEVMASNATTIADEDGDFPDWLELYNSGEEVVSLGGFGLTDDPEDLFQWILPETDLAPGEHLLIFASSKDRAVVSNHWETVVNWGDDWHYFVGYSAPPEEWRSPDYVDSYWPVGPSGFGYGDGDDATIVQPVISVFIRKTFVIDAIENIQAAILHVDFDDAFVAYLNGIEIARVNIGTPGIPPAFDQSADTWIEAVLYSGGVPDAFSDAWQDNLLQEGPNTLAIEVHNYGAGSSDLSLIPFFTLGMSEIPDNPNGTPEFMNFQVSPLHTNFKISAEGEDILLTSPEGVVIDSISTGPIPTDIALGRYPDGSESWWYFDAATPGTGNSDNGYAGFLPDPVFSIPAGFYTGAVSVSISCENPQADIHFTMDGSTPTQLSDGYMVPVFIDETTVIRARAFHTGFFPSNCRTQTYLMDVDTQLPVISLSTDPVHFFDYNSGIYVMGPGAEPWFPYFGANFWQDWERPIHIELFETDHQTGFSSNAGVKIFGGWSRGLPQKSLSFFARSQYGASEFSYSFFPDLDIDTYEAFILRNSGNDWESTMMRDGMMTSLVREADIDLMAYRPTAVYLNGDYWGLYNLREKLNEHFIASHHAVDPDDIDLLEMQGVPINGDADHYQAMLDFLDSSDISQPENYEIVQSMMDVDNFISYQAAEIYFDNQDWPGNNIKYWRSRTDNGKWRWILYDTDYGFGIWDPFAYTSNTLAFALEPNGPGWPNPPWSTYLLRTLLENESFESQFINQFCDDFNTIFAPAHVIGLIQSISQTIEPEMPDHYDRWGGSIFEWVERINVLETFAQERPAYVLDHLRSEFNLGDMGQVIVGIATPNTGTIQVNSLTPEAYPWFGMYFQDVPIQLTAMPAAGYIFTGWSGNYGSQASIAVTVQNTTSITAYFDQIPDYEEDIVINEINYNSDNDADPGDWIEFFNNTPFEINVSGWYFCDSDDSHIYLFPAGSILHPNEYIVLSDDMDEFLNFFPDFSSAVAEINFGFSGSGELLRLFNAAGELVDSVTYDDDAPWPESPDGGGPTLELIHPDLDNSLPESWAASTGIGTPGAENSVFTQGCVHNGDANLDGDISVIDIVVTIAHILGEEALGEVEACQADVIFDGSIDILDIVRMVEIILSDD